MSSNSLQAAHLLRQSLAVLRLREIDTVWLFVALAWAHLGDVLFPHRWAAFVSGLGLISAVFVWTMRGPRFALRWFICLWGAIEGLQVFVCHLSYNWWPKTGPRGLCEAYTNFPLYWYGICSILVLSIWVARMHATTDMADETEPMPLGERRSHRRLMRFDPTFSMGSIAQIVALLVALIVAYGKYEADRTRTNEQIEAIKAVAASDKALAKEAINELKQDVRQVQTTITSVDKTVSTIKAEIDARNGAKGK